MQRYKLNIEYDGTHFSGWQKQPGERTVEGEIENSLSVLYQEEIDIIGQGRTDAGVHAYRQIAHVDLPIKYRPKRVLHAMKGLLPEDISIFKIEKVSPGFHARFDALSRSYSYRITTNPSPIYRHISWYHYAEPDIENLQNCAELILGEHNFIQFCIPSGDSYQTTVCTISESEWSIDSGFFIYKITGNRFLRHMVRRLVGTMMQCATGNGSISTFEALLKSDEKNHHVFTAPAKGLILENVNY